MAGRKCRRRERLALLPVDHELDEELVVPKVHKVAGTRNILSELFRQDRRVGRSDTKRDKRPDIAENGFKDVRIELCRVLVGKTSIRGLGIGSPGLRRAKSA